ncbi:MAG: hypothetical protein UW28_C0009G0018 [Parcubacteria group bacterium GW2011_GWA2_44_13]|nr:MAG: hypothetical protein UW28_C0009G0018 [Parcubacteria group bacterium GW2011_GWA2_44_13]OGF96849.1 MAG: hypothetical protein A3H08_00950 [Candidatus Giovannonibacteria bacterium RIFCSPLOWO2_12_FULL_44_32]
MMIILLLLALQYPPDIQNYLERADAKAVCAAGQTGAKSVLILRNSNEKWLIRVFIKNGEPVEIWFNNYVLFKFFLYSGDEVYYRLDGDRWINKDAIPKNEADKLDARIKFNKKEIRILEKCFEKKME